MQHAAALIANIEMKIGKESNLINLPGMRDETRDQFESELVILILLKN